MAKIPENRVVCRTLQGSLFIPAPPIDLYVTSSTNLYFWVEINDT